MTPQSNRHTHDMPLQTPLIQSPPLTNTLQTMSAIPYQKSDTTYLNHDWSFTNTQSTSLSERTHGT